jgi:excisionase family DNA binding protein
VSDAARQELEPLIDAETAARILGMSTDWCYQEAAAGRLPAFKIGGRRMFRASELEAFIQARRSGRIASVHPIGDRRR